MAASRNSRSPDPVAVLRSALRHGLVGAAASLGRAEVAGLRCAVGFSGGRDSSVLLHALAGLRADTGIALSAVHVHHGLSPDADAWAAFCVDTCASWGVPLVVERVVVDRAGGQGIEGAARLARHAVLARQAVDLVALAHHAGDQAETLLFNLLRGAGLAGAAGMAVLRPAADAPALFRPWLDAPPEFIEAYRARFGIAHVDDASNRDTALSRNFLRHSVLPPVAARFPGAVGRLAAAARRLGEARALLAELADADLAGRVAGHRLDWAGLSGLSERRRRNALRRWLETRPAVLGEDGLDELCRQIDTAGADARVGRRVGAFDLRFWRGGLYALSRRAAAADAGPRTWAGEAGVDWAGGRLFFDPRPGEGLAARWAGRVELRRRQGGERLRLAAGGPSRALRVLFQEAALPPWERERVPLLWVGDVLAAVPGVGVAAGFAAAADEAGCALRWEG